MMTIESVHSLPTHWGIKLAEYKWWRVRLGKIVECINCYINNMVDKNRDTIPFYGGNPSDIRLSHWEYHDFIDQLLDDRLTAQGLMKFKRLHSQMSMNAIMVPIVSFFPAYFANRWLAGSSDLMQDLSIGDWLHQGTTFWG